MSYAHSQYDSYAPSSYGRSRYSSSSSSSSGGRRSYASYARPAASYIGQSARGQQSCPSQNCGAAPSALEHAIYNSAQPVPSRETEQVSAEFAGQRAHGVYVNRSEAAGWRGDQPLSAYQLNQDNSPRVVQKAGGNVTHVQTTTVKFLQPPPVPAPGDITIVRGPDSATGPAPPLIIRQGAPKPKTPAPLVLRERAPQAPQVAGPVTINIPGRKLPAAPRKVILEQLAAEPAKPQDVVVERWLAYGQNQDRRVIYKAGPAAPAPCKPRNVLVKWSAPSVSLSKQVKNLGVERADPADYNARFGSSLVDAHAFSQLQLSAPQGTQFAADSKHSDSFRLVGDVGALQHVDLERYGLSAYRTQVAQADGHRYAVPAAGEFQQCAQ